MLNFKLDERPSSVWSEQDKNAVDKRNVLFKKTKPTNNKTHLIHMGGGNLVTGRSADSFLETFLVVL